MVYQNKIAAISIAEKVGFLSQKTAYPDATSFVKVIETHRSWVFLTEDFAYKLKKPVKNSLHDYSTLEARLYNSQEELRLNRRLAANIYLNVVPLKVDKAGHLFLEEGGGQTVDWLVKMKRIPAENMLDISIKNNTLRGVEIDRVALKLAKFYQLVPAENISYLEQRQLLEAEIHQSSEVLLNPAFQLDSKKVRRISAMLFHFLEENELLFQKRIEEGHIKEGHGDLRPEHICLRPKSVIIDCLEFNRKLRILDPADELAFLAIECELLGLPKIGGRFIKKYSALTGDAIPAILINFYKALRALVRARLAILHLLELPYESDSKWRKKTEQYLKIADNNAGRLIGKISQC